MEEKCSKPGTSTGGETIVMQKTEKNELWSATSSFKSSLLWPKPNLKPIGKR